MKTLRNFALALLAMFCAAPSQAGVVLTKSYGWFESACVEWQNGDYSSFNVYYRADGGSYTLLGNSITGTDESGAARMGLVRNYGSTGRADVIGIVAGKYQFKVVPVSGTAEVAADATETDLLDVVAHDRAGFAHVGMPGGIGAYKNDGTLKEGAKVIYVTAQNAKSVSTKVITSSKGATTTANGLQDIIYLYQKGYDKTPLAIRFVGLVKLDDLDAILSSAEGIQVKGNAAFSEMNITLEGVGEDATVSGFGFLVRNCKSVEFRNFGIMLCMDDAISLDTSNSNVWVHNMDFFYGKTGGDSDQAKGDGTFDVKGKSTNITLSYCHFFDNGKSSLGGMKSESTDCVLTYHHNWFDHSDSRHPRIRTMSFHIYNNYFDGCSKYGVGMTYGGSAFVERNFFRNTKYPMLISKQGTDATGDGTFSGEPGGVIKSFDNHIVGAKRFVKYSGVGNDWDAVEVANASDVISSDVKCVAGATSYNNFDTNGTLSYAYDSDNAQDVPSIVKGDLGAGRMGHGDFQWTFNNATQDENYGLITELKQAIADYKSSLVGFYGGDALPNGGGSGAIAGGDSDSGDDYQPGYGGSDADSDATGDDLMPFIASDDLDYFWFNKENEAKVNAWLADGTISLVTGSATNKDGVVPSPSFDPSYSYDAVANNKTFPSTEHVGAIKVGQASAAGKNDGGSFIFNCSRGIAHFGVYVYRTGSVYLQVFVSNDGKTWGSAVYSVDKGKSGYMEIDLSSKVKSDEPVYVKILNTSTGGLNIQGVCILCQDDEAAVTAVGGVKESILNGGANGTYDLNGRNARNGASGLLIQNGKVIFAK